MVVRGDKTQAERHDSLAVAVEDADNYFVDIRVLLTGSQIGERAWFYWTAYGITYGVFIGDNQLPVNNEFILRVDGSHLPVGVNQVFHLAHQNDLARGPESTHILEIRGTTSDDPNFWGDGTNLVMAKVVQR